MQNDEDDKESSVSIIKIYSDEREEGMSGTPVLDLDTNRVVGIISLHYPKDNNVDTKLNFPIAVESINKVYPPIKEKNPGFKILEDNQVNNTDPVDKRNYHAFLSREYVDKITADNLYEWLRVAYNI